MVLRSQHWPLVGLKENVIIGKLIPAGTGMKCYRSVALDTDEAADEFLMKKSLAANGELEEEEIKEQPNEAEVVEEEEEVVYSTSTEE